MNATSIEKPQKTIQNLTFEENVTLIGFKRVYFFFLGFFILNI